MGIGFHSTRQIISLSINTVSPAQASTTFAVMLGNADQLLVQALCPISGTFNNLFILSSAPAADQTLIATFGVNTADTAIICMVTGAGTTAAMRPTRRGSPNSLKLVTSATLGLLVVDQRRRFR
jgi:hypothetical protein